MPAFQQSAQMAQAQVLSPQMRQSLEILQATALELQQMVRQELEGNPVLEEEPPEEDESEEEDADEDAESPEANELAQLEDDWGDFSAQGAVDPEAEARRMRFLEGIAPAETLASHLEKQVGRLALDPVQRRIVSLLIGNLDENGYLAASPEDVADEAGAETAEAVEMLHLLQTMDPPGVGARDLSECLRLQLDRFGPGHGAARSIVRDRLDLLGRKKFAEIASALKLSQDQVREAGALIARLNPKPGRAFAGEAAQVLAPDVIIEKVGQDYVVSLVRDSIPNLRISRTYRDLLGESGGSPEVRGYLRDKIRGGKFIIKSIRQRQQTILSIAREIASRQRMFLGEGVAALVPMTMAQVAEVVGVHETTVSRAIAGKTVATPQGVFEMKFFFTTGYTTAGGAEVSNTSVKDAIAALIRVESGRQPLSDQQIMDKLKAEGLPVARRTVAKYREALGFLPSHLRKSF
ncbi:MAG: RNA polymerase factor sigma-54 [Chthoniobacterales bacterium]|jgi:RNA polymerase sigma-54 factor|nr:RNA polymerase factor sigma-54 [Chthoniobacterales bacterium]